MSRVCRRPGVGAGGPAQPALCLSRANEEIAQVRSKAQAEALAFQASLRKEQMRVHSLEKAVEQKVGAGGVGGGAGPLPGWATSSLAFESWATKSPRPL